MATVLNLTQLAQKLWYWAMNTPLVVRRRRGFRAYKWRIEKGLSPADKAHRNGRGRWHRQPGK